MMRCLIVDDGPVAREILRTYVSDTPDLELVDECEDAMQALSVMQHEKVDVIFLDINMPKLSGISFLKSLNDPPAVILTTAYSEYALEGFELNVTDYLLKPFSFERFLKAVNKVTPSFVSGDEASSAPLIIKTDGRTFRIRTQEIHYLESQGDYVVIHTGETKYTVYDRMKSLLDRLPATDFIRIHKSYAVAIRHIDYVEGNRVMINDTELPIGKTYKDNFLKQFGM